MYGLAFVLLQNFMETKFDNKAWKEILAGVNLPVSRIYFSYDNYSDGDFFRLVDEAAKKLVVSREIFLDEYGYFAGNFVMQNYSKAINSNWKTSELLENFKFYYDRILGARSSDSEPGILLESRKNKEGEIVILYRSPRKLCPLIIGIFKSVAHYYKEEILIAEPQCMLKGAAMCEFVVTILKARL